MPNDPNEQPEYVLRCRKCAYYFVFILFILLFLMSWLCLFETIIPYLVTENVTQIHPAYDNSIEFENIMWPLFMVPMSVFACLMVLTMGNTYFYERYFKCIPIIPFMKPRTMYYDNAHLHIYLENSRKGGAELNQYEKMPRWWKNPYTRFKICCFESIRFSFSFFM